MQPPGAKSMAEEEEPAPAPMSVFRQAHEEQRYNLLLLEQYRLMEGQIYGEHASEEAVAAMAAANLSWNCHDRCPSVRT